MGEEGIQLYCRKCKRSIDFQRAEFPDVPSWVARIEHDKCNICDDGGFSAEHWIDEAGKEPDPEMMPSIHDEAPCTDCGDTGTTIQTERACACSPHTPKGPLT